MDRGQRTVARNVLQKYCGLDRVAATERADALSAEQVEQLTRLAGGRSISRSAVELILDPPVVPVRREIRPPRPEIRSTKSETNPKSQIPNPKPETEPANPETEPAKPETAESPAPPAPSPQPPAKTHWPIPESQSPTPDSRSPIPVRVRLRGLVPSPGRSGPCRGQWALQRALRARVKRDGIDWFDVGGRADPTDLVWYWSWSHVPEMLWWIRHGGPIAVGPNILFQHSRTPLLGAGELDVCRCRTCRLLFTESAWYARLISKYIRKPNMAPIVVWPYPIDPQPAGPLPPIYDLLIYAKSGPLARIVPKLQAACGRVAVFRYGRFNRGDLIEAARRSRACVYLSIDDRGPLGLAEVLLTGCPAVGIERGAPWIETGRTGVRVGKLTVDEILPAVETLIGDRGSGIGSRESVRAEALAMFDTDRTLDVIFSALDAARRL